MLDLRKISVLFALGYILLVFSVTGNAQEQLSEPPIILELDSEYAIRDLNWNFDSRLLAFVGGGEDVTIVNIGTSDTEEVNFAGESIAWNATKNYLLIANQATELLDYDEQILVNGFEFPITEDYTPVGNVDWHPTEDKFAILLRECDEGTPARPGARVEIWDIITSTFTEIGGCISRGFGEVRWNPQGTQLAINGFSVFDDEGFVDFEEIEIWDVNTAERILTITDLQDPWGLAWNPTGDLIAFTTRVNLDRYIQVWDVANDELVWQVEANLGVYVPLDWHPSENLIATGGQDGSVRIWDALSGLELIELPVHEDNVNDVSWSPDGNMLASVGRDGRLFVWDVSALLQD